MRSADFMIKSGTAFAILHWVVCRKNYFDERETTYALIAMQKKQAIARRAAAAKVTREKPPQECSPSDDQENK